MSQASQLNRVLGIVRQARAAHVEAHRQAMKGIAEKHTETGVTIALVESGWVDALTWVIDTAWQAEIDELTERFDSLASTLREAAE